MISACYQECCEWRELVFKALNQQNTGPEYYEALETWLELGKKERGVEFDCVNCDSFYSQVENKILTFIEQEGLEGFKKQVSCCQTIGMIYDIYDKPNLNRYAGWLATYKEVMCSECNDKAKQVAIDTGLREYLIKNWKRLEKL